MAGLGAHSVGRARVVATARAAGALLVAALVLGLALPAPGASAREGNSPLTHFAGTYRIADATGHEDWEWADPDSDPAMTLPGGTWIEVRWPGGRCTDPAHGDVLRVATFGHPKRCG